jgi:hypothetical protein
VEVARIAPPVALRVGVGLRGEGVEEIGDVVVALLAPLEHLPPELVLGPLGRGQVPEVL